MAPIFLLMPILPFLCLLFNSTNHLFLTLFKELGIIVQTVLLDPTDFYISKDHLTLYALLQLSLSISIPNIH